MYIQPRTYLIEWADDHPLSGLEISVRSCSIEQMEAVERLTLIESLDALAAQITGWNLESEPGQMAPIGAAALRALEPAIAKSIVAGWFRAAWGADLPLVSPRASADGPVSPDTDDAAPSTLGLASLSASLPS